MKGRRLTTFAHGEGGFGVQRTLHAAVQHGAARLAALPELTTDIAFRFLVFEKK